MSARLVRLSTDGFQAERELDELNDEFGSFRTQQFTKAVSIPVQAAIFEIEEFWDLELKERPGFEIQKNVVRMPTLFSKLSGVNQLDEESYWLNIKEKFMTPETFVYESLPHANPSTVSMVSGYVTSFLRNGKLVRDLIKTHRCYTYNLLRPDIQDHMLDKIQEILDERLIREAGPNSTAYMVVAAALSLPKEIWRLIQQFDFTRKNPKILVLHASESTGSLQDAVQLLFLNKIGFDVLFCVPSGYQCVEQWYSVPIVDDHPVGSYEYNYRVPDFRKVGKQSRQGLFGFFKRS